MTITNVERGESAYILELVFCHPAYHGAARLFAGGRALDGLAVADAFAKEACDDRGIGGEAGQNGFGVFHAGEVDDRGVGACRSDGPCELVAPKRVEVSGIVDGKLRAHLQPIRFNGMKGAYASVESREDPQMVLQPCELRGIHHLGRHALVLDAMVGHDGGGDSTRDIGIGEVGIAQDGHKFVKRIQARCKQPVAHVPKGLKTCRAILVFDAQQRLMEPGRLMCKRRYAPNVKGILSCPHLFGGRNDDL